MQPGSSIKRLSLGLYLRLCYWETPCVAEYIYTYSTGGGWPSQGVLFKAVLSLCRGFTV